MGPRQISIISRVDSERRPSKAHIDIRYGDRLFSWIVWALGLGIILLMAALVFELIRMSMPILSKFGFSFLWGTEWNPVTEEFGALPFIFGTVVSSLLALLIATPLSVGVALLLTDIVPKGVGTLFGFLIEMLAAIPSVVYGIWGIYVLAPFLRDFVEPWLGKNLGFLPLFQGPPFGVGMMAAALILAVMIIPTILAICREVFKAIPVTQREAALGLGATRTEMMWIAVLAESKLGIFGAVILGLGRAFGETMAVTMVIGNRAQISASLFSPAQTMASLIANEYTEATSDFHLSALAAIGLSLFLVSLLINALAFLVVRQFAVSKNGGRR